MNVEWVAIALGDVSWISLAFLLGFLARLISLPPLVGFLATGFLLNYLGMSSGESLQKLADLGITLLLFTVGLKLNLKVLIKSEVWAVTALHIAAVVTIFSIGLLALSAIKLSIFSALDFKLALLLAFAFSFSSTVFVVKALEEKGEMKSLHGRIAIGILVMQDLAAVIFLAASSGSLPSIWALLLFLLIPLRPFFYYLLQKTGHGELLILFGLVMALGGAELFELANVKDDLGALMMGVLISTHPKANEMAKSMLGFKDLFLVGFFLSIGMTGQLSIEALIVGLALVPFIVIKSALFFALLTRFKLRARTALLSSINLSNYSEFGLIVIAIAVSQAWIDAQWLVAMAIALSISFVVVAPFSRNDDKIYRRFREYWIRFQAPQETPASNILQSSNAKLVIFGMGRVGSGAYDKMRECYGNALVGIDFDADVIKHHISRGRNVFRGDPSDADFWEAIKQNHSIELIMLALPNFQANSDALAQLRAINFTGRITAIARFPDEVPLLQKYGATAVYNIYTEAGAGFAEHVVKECPVKLTPQTDNT